MLDKETCAKIAHDLAAYAIAKESKQKLLCTADDLVNEREASAKAQAVVQQEAKRTQEQIRYHIEDIVNMALEAVFGDTYEFQLIFEVKRNKTEARIVLIEDGHEIDPLDSTGGGLADVLATVLRVALLMISKAPKVLVLDEPTKHLSEGLRPAYFEIIKKLSSDLGVQIIAVTHDEGFVASADKAITVKKQKRVSYTNA